ncbi:MAG: App1 family protein [Ancrocorticia sp.]|uniref:App1 family protein n=1 Tax=Ancrocorticia sp. TaxID=2593684 RepID=UPI003F911C9F
MALADIARALDNGINRRGIVRRRAQGWLPRIFPFTGYGSTTELRVLGRALMVSPDEDRPFTFPFLPRGTHSPLAERPVSQLLDAHGPAIDAVDDMVEIASERAREYERGWRQFFTTQVGYLPVTVEIAGRRIESRTDSSGYIDLLVPDHGLAPGWHEATITPRAGEPATAPILVIEPDAKLGLISDVDDTIVITWLPRMALAAWNSFVRRTNTRQPVPGMAAFYAELLREYPDSPVFYLSTGAWNTLPAMQEFITENHLPTGPLLMTDWGPTPTGLFRSGQEHKKTQLRNLIIMFPQIRWFLVGDDGQHDPFIYGELAREHPRHVAGIALRQLNPVEKVLSQGALVGLEPQDTPDISVPLITAKDGFGLLAKIREMF